VIAWGLCHSTEQHFRCDGEAAPPLRFRAVAAAVRSTKH